MESKYSRRTVQGATRELATAIRTAIKDLGVETARRFGWRMEMETPDLALQITQGKEGWMDWLDIYRRAGLTPGVGDAVRDLLNVAHGSRDWTAGIGPRALATELRSRWLLLREGATAPAVVGGQSSPHLGDFDLPTGRMVGDAGLLLVRSLAVPPAVREYWLAAITHARDALEVGEQTDSNEQSLSTFPRKDTTP